MPTSRPRPPHLLERSPRRIPIASLLRPLVLALLLVLLLVGAAAADSVGTQQQQEQGQEQAEEVLPLPGPFEGVGSAVPQLKFGEKMRFDELGPIIINKDGTTRCVWRVCVCAGGAGMVEASSDHIHTPCTCHRRITNWRKMTQWEQERTLDRIAKRNQARMAEL